MSTITERVAAGAAFLDEHDPGWWRADVERAIDLDTLSLRSGNRCVLGQRCPAPPAPESNRTAYVVYGFQLTGLNDDDALWEWGVPLGITAAAENAGQMSAEHDALTAAWKHVITERRAAA